MECQPSDSKKLFKVFDASKRNRSRKKREGLDDSNSVLTDSTSGCPGVVCRVPSAKASLQEIATVQNLSGQHDSNITKRMGRDSSPSASQSPVETHRHARSPRRHRRSAREGVSLALKAGLVSTPRSVSPRPQEAAGESMPQDQDSFIYAFLEEAIKRDKKKHRHARRREERRSRDDDDREHSSIRDRHRHHHRDHRHRDDVPSRDHDVIPKEVPPSPPPPPAAPPIDQSMLIETFAKICAQINNNKSNQNNTHKYEVPRTHSHKSLQCEVIAKRSEAYETDRPVKLSHEQSREKVGVSRIRSQENFSGKTRTRENSKILIPNEVDRVLLDRPYYEKDIPKFVSKLEIARSRMRHAEDDRFPEYPPAPVPTRSCVDPYRARPPDYRDYDREMRRHYEEDRKRYEQRTSRSFDVHREGYDDERNCRRTARSDTNRIRRYEERDKRYDEVGKYYDEKPVKYYDDKPMEPRPRNNASKDRRWRRNLERCDRNSVASREDDYRDKDRERERDRYSERERDSGMSVADGETSTVSGKSNYLKVVKQEIAEQREAMDKMMKLWKELMRCFKGFSQTQVHDKDIKNSADNVRESAAAQLRLWRECMRRYETVARDVGDTDARLMEEIKKQRSEMAEMATMWQECLQRYRDMSNDFNNLKQQVQLARPESPTRLPAQPVPVVCSEGEGPMPPAPYRLPPNYPHPQHMPLPPGPQYPSGGSPLRGRASAPPAWWWCPEPGAREPRRRSSPESRTSRERDRRHRHKERDEPKYKEKSKPSAAHSEHRHRKR
ncbi:hypothetical protein PYW08_008781 [Mythimna loreyi]|uniref:Uncharacterized protein n=1 Tax=Mythimna loreyi TaxID=667449 RepID=A0ACC2Q9L5_9NEOP|nr:hypothetical protein PYW08_008781 [Mythimna loreyi]